MNCQPDEVTGTARCAQRSALSEVHFTGTGAETRIRPEATGAFGGSAAKFSGPGKFVSNILQKQKSFSPKNVSYPPEA